jgi:ABC-type hemin transport system substrate-binding protein
MNLTRRSLLTFGALSLQALACRRHATAGGPQRIVSLNPVATEMLFELGAGARVVGVSSLCDAPAAAMRLRRVGSMVAPDVAAIEALRPDAIVGVEGPLAVDALTPHRARGAKMHFPRIETYAEMRVGLRSFASFLGDTERAHDAEARLDAGLARVHRAVAGRVAPRVLAVVSTEPLLVIAGRGSWIDEVIRRAGAQNAAQHARLHPIVSIEQVAGWVPEVIVDLTWHAHTPPIAQAWAQYTTLPAIAYRRVVRIENSVMFRQGPRLPEAAALLARALFPGVSV